MIPSAETCFKLMETHGMLDHIREHSIMVERIATLIARGLRDAGMNISLEKVTAGALMHDIAKTESLETGVDHTARGKAICLENQMDEIADIVGEHVTLKSYDPVGFITEQEIVYYADKRVNHATVVSLEERLTYLIQRYGRGKEHIHQAILQNFNRCKEVEKRLFSRLSFGPEDMAERVERERGEERC
jgi:uncharacterized protein